MLNYIRAEFYKVLRRKYTWITLGVVLLLEGLLAAGFAFTNAHGNHVDFYTGASMLLVLLPLGFYATILTCDMVFADQYKHATLKNEVAFGIPRSRIYLGKLAVELVVSVVFCVAMVGFYLGLCYVALEPSSSEDVLTMLQLTGYCLLTALPLWVGMLGVNCACFFLVRSNLWASLIGVLFLTALPLAVDVGRALFFNLPLGTALGAVYSYLPTVILEETKMAAGWPLCARAWLVGAVWFAASAAIGLWGFRRKEVK